MTEFQQSFQTDHFAGVSSSFGTDSDYQSLNPRGRRRGPSRSQVKPEDLLLTQNRRDKLNTNALDVWRNFGLLAWAIRRTLDYCCLWDFHPKTGNAGFDTRVRELMTRDTEAERIDFVGRAEWDDMRRIAEAQKILTGDMFFVKLAEGTLQMVEGSYCKNPDMLTGRANQRWKNGALLNRRGRVLKWNFREQLLQDDGFRRPNDRSVKASSVWQHVQYEARANQLRPPSMIQAALNEFRDLDETFDHARATVKLQQLFGLVFKRSPGANDDLGDAITADGEPDDSGDSTGSESNVRHIDFGGEGPALIDLDEDESIDTITGMNPSGNTQQFLKQLLMLALKSLDLPYSFLDESHSTFHGQRGGWIQYTRACHARRRSQQRLHNKMTRWRLWRWILPPSLGGTGELALPRGMSIDDIKFRWVPRGMPWWKPQEELESALKEAAAGLRTMQGVCDEWGLGVYRENVADLVALQRELHEQELTLEFNTQKVIAALVPINQKAA